MDDVKAIFLDMDGTLLHENNQVSLYTKEVIDQLRTQGYKVFLARVDHMMKFTILCLNILKLMVSLVLMGH